MRFRGALAVALLTVTGTGLLGACHRSARFGTTEVRLARAEPSPPAIPWSRVLARASTHALAVTSDHVLFGDDEKDAVLSVPKEGGEPVVLGRPAPLDIAAVGPQVAWIGKPGDILYRTPLGGPADVLLSRGKFTAVTAQGADLFVTEVTGNTGTLIRVDGKSSSRLVAFDYPPRDLVADDAGVYVMTDSEIHAMSHDGSDIRILVAGHELAGLALSDDFVFTTSDMPTGRVLLRVSKRGREVEALAREVRKGPIAAWGKHVYFLDREGSALWHVPIAGGTPELVARSPDLAWTAALRVDASGIYVALDRLFGGMILALRHPA